jgi:site-specific recombinase XerD
MREGFPLKVISKAMGHSSIAVTERYLNISHQDDIEPMIQTYGKKLESFSEGSR